MPSFRYFKSFGKLRWRIRKLIEKLELQQQMVKKTQNCKNTLVRGKQIQIAKIRNSHICEVTHGFSDIRLIEVNDMCVLIIFISLDWDMNIQFAWNF